MFVHPSQPPGLEPLPGMPTYVADFLLDTTRAAVRLAASGTLDRCPDLRVILSHAGGFVPYAAYRLALAASPKGNPIDGLAQLQKFYFDIALSGSPTALPSLLAFAKPGHVLFGSDFPYAPDFVVGVVHRPVRALSRSTTTCARRSIAARPRRSSRDCAGERLMGRYAHAFGPDHPEATYVPHAFPRADSATPARSRSTTRSRATPTSRRCS